MNEKDARSQLISEIVSILEIKPAEMAAINDEFKELMATNSETTEDMIRSCKIYDSASFIAGAMVTTTAEKVAERDRLEGNRMDAM